MVITARQQTLLVLGCAATDTASEFRKAISVSAGSGTVSRLLGWMVGVGLAVGDIAIVGF